MRLTHSFRERLAFSLAERQAFDVNLIRDAIPGCIGVRKTDADVDKTGVDYIAELRRGAEILIDAKARERGASRFWRGEPELALESWSVIPDSYEPDGKPGWTLSESTPVDMILYTFDPSDTNNYYLLPFQFLRAAFVRNYRTWRVRYGARRQYNSRWMSEAIFVPASVVIGAVSQEMVGNIGETA